jgi:hypothetical protein
LYVSGQPFPPLEVGPFDRQLRHAPGVFGSRHSGNFGLTHHS